MSVFQGFKNFLMQGDLVVVAVGLSIALAFSTLVKAFADTVITPLVNAAGGGGTNGLGFTVNGQRLFRTAPVQGLPGLPLGRLAARGHEVPLLRDGPHPG